MQDLGHAVYGEHFQIWGRMERVGEVCVFNGKLAVHLIHSLQGFNLLVLGSWSHGNYNSIYYKWQQQYAYRARIVLTHLNSTYKSMQNLGH